MASRFGLLLAGFHLSHYSFDCSAHSFRVGDALGALAGALAEEMAEQEKERERLRKELSENEDKVDEDKED